MGGSRECYKASDEVPRLPRETQHPKVIPYAELTIGRGHGHTAITINKLAQLAPDELVKMTRPHLEAR